MIAEIAKYLGSIQEDDQGQRTSPPAVCVVEAGTGTGKTLAYCMSVLPLALDEKRKVIISTATTIAAFIPLGLWPGRIGKFMIFFPITLSAY